MWQPETRRLAAAMTPESFPCYLVRKTDKHKIEAGIERRPLVELPAGDLLIEVAYSSLNYKDALAATGHPGVVRKFPHVPGIDAAGTVVESSSDEFMAGDRVIVTGYELGAQRWGGWAGYVRVPVEWAVPLPERLSLEESMVYGTAGLTAALSVRTLQHHGVTADAGKVLVTGATGGVGVMAVKLLSKLGYTVVAVSGKVERHSWLKELGASNVIGRGEVNDESDKPLLPALWSGAVDTVGGNTLATILRSTQISGCVAACGLVGGAELPLTVYPFILRGVTLAGIDSAWCAREHRIEIWQQLAGEWKLDGLDAIAATFDLTQVDEHVQRILNGQVTGRILITPREQSCPPS